MLMASKHFPHVEVTKDNNKPSKSVRQKIQEIKFTWVFLMAVMALNTVLLNIIHLIL